jgi:hypothetical protein
MTYKQKYDCYHEAFDSKESCYAVKAWENDKEYNKIINNIIEQNKDSLIRYDGPFEEMYGPHPWGIRFWFHSDKDIILEELIPDTLLDKYLNKE